MPTYRGREISKIVLILVVVEYEFVANEKAIFETDSLVLILVVVEYEFVGLGNRNRQPIWCIVLILVVVEYEFVDIVASTADITNIRLNPCCSGIWIRSFGDHYDKYDLALVLILVVVEYEFVVV